MAEAQKDKQLDINKSIKQKEEAHRHNTEMAQDFVEGQEGTDYIHLKPGQVAPGEINEKKLKREIKKELDELKLREPDLAEEYRRYLFSNDTELDRDLAQEIPED